MQHMHGLSPDPHLRLSSYLYALMAVRALAFLAPLVLLPSPFAPRRAAAEAAGAEGLAEARLAPDGPEAPVQRASLLRAYGG